MEFHIYNLTTESQLITAVSFPRLRSIRQYSKHGSISGQTHAWVFRVGMLDTFYCCFRKNKTKKKQFSCSLAFDVCFQVSVLRFSFLHKSFCSSALTFLRIEESHPSFCLPLYIVTNRNPQTRPHMASFQTEEDRKNSNPTDFYMPIFLH